MKGWLFHSASYIELKYCYILLCRDLENIELFGVDFIPLNVCEANEETMLLPSQDNRERNIDETVL